MHFLKSVLFLAALSLFVTLCGCGGGEGRANTPEENSAVSSEQVYPVGSYERRAAEYAAAGKDISGREVTDFGAESIFKGIAVESDENGELLLLYSETEGILLFRVTDRRFGTLRELAGFVRKYAGERKTELLGRTFKEKDGMLYFALGDDSHDVRSSRKFSFVNPERMTVQAIYSDRCRRTTGIARSEAHFVKDDGVWKLDRLVIIRE